MNKPAGYDEATPQTHGEFKKIPAGGHVLGIVKVEQGFTRADSKNGEQPKLVLFLDIAEGEFKNEYRRMSEQFKKPCYLQMHLPYQGKDVAFFKGAITAIEESNGQSWNWQESSLIGKKVGGNLREKEYINSKDELKTILEVAYLCSIKTIKEGVDVLPIKKKFGNIPQKNTANDSDSFVDNLNTPSDLPF
jgi:hypothetical protein